MKPSSHCRSCGAPVRWVFVEPHGRRMPLDPDPVPDGNVWIHHYEAGTPVVAVALNSEGVPANETMRYIAHFVTCPDAAEWRKRGRQGQLDI